MILPLPTLPPSSRLFTVQASVTYLLDSFGGAEGAVGRSAQREGAAAAAAKDAYHLGANIFFNDICLGSSSNSSDKAVQLKVVFFIIFDGQCE